MGFPLQGVRILELGQIIAGTYGGQMLSDMGAEVIKIETPQGDLGRIPSVAPINGESALFLTLNRNKQSIVIDLKTNEGLQIFYDLVKISDVVVDNFRPGVLERLKIDYATLKELNPRIIQCSITGYGASGEYKDSPALDIIIQSMAGYMAVTGEPGRPPVRTGIPIADLCGGIFSSQAVLAALFDRERTGEGRYIELSMFDGMLSLLIYMGTMWLTKGELPEPPGSGHMYSVPWQAFKCADGYLVVATRQEVFWTRLCDALDAPELAADPRFETNPLRVENRDTLVPMLETIFAKRTVADWMTRFRAGDIPAAPVNNLDGAFAEPP
ncbi:MAG: CoA transferase, partial [Rhizobiales bacterium]|nr:CoA transferase [Hyphomicrobiales bacterium]